MDKKDEEQHSMSKPKPLEVVSDGDLTEIKKDPIAWKAWLKEKDATNTKQAREKLPRKEYCPTCGQVDPIASGQQKEEGQSHGEQGTAARGGSTLYTDSGDDDPDRKTSPRTSGWKTGRTGGKGFREALYNDLGDPRAYSNEYYPGQMSDSDDKGIKVHMGSRDYDRESFDKRQRDDKGAMKKSWEVWLDNVTKPIPDSKGGRGSFQHCIDTNQDKNNPGGWCKQIERKIGGDKKKDGGMAGGTGSTYEEGESKDSETQDHVRTGFAQNTQYPKKGKDEGEGEEVKISMYEKLRRIKDKLEAHNKGLGALGEGKLNRKTGKPMKLKPRKITLDDFEHDDKPSYFKQVASEEKKKKEKKKARPRTTGSGFGKAKNKRPPIKGISSYRQGPKKMENQGNKDQMLGGKKRSGEAWMKFWNEHRGEILQDETDELVEANTSDSNKADYFVEEIRSNIIYHNKIFPLIGMVAGQAARGMGKLGKKVGGEILEGAGELSQGVMQEAQEEEEQ